MLQRNILFKTVIVIILLGIFIFFGSWGPIGRLRELSVKVVRPLLQITAGVNTVGSTLSDREVFEAELQEVRFRETILREENEQLREILAFRASGGVSMRGAKVLSYFNELGKEFLLVDQGSDVGVQEGDFVLADETRIVGVVHEVGATFSHVAVASNVDRTFEGELIPTGATVLVRGTGARSFSLELLPINIPVQRGDFVSVVSVAQGVRQRLLLGTIIAVDESGGSTFQEAQASFLVRPESLHDVFIIVSP